MECWDFLGKRIEHAVIDMFDHVINQGHGVGLVLTSQCEINGAPALGILLRIMPDNLYTLTETGFTLDTRLQYVERPEARAWALDEEVRARLQFPLDCQIRVNFRDICLVIAIGPFSEGSQAYPWFATNEDGVATAAMWARAYDEWQVRWTRPSATRRARRTHADDQP
jgi:hypothetical protein